MASSPLDFCFFVSCWFFLFLRLRRNQSQTQAAVLFAVDGKNAFRMNIAPPVETGTNGEKQASLERHDVTAPRVFADRDGIRRLCLQGGGHSSCHADGAVSNLVKNKDDLDRDSICGLFIKTLTPAP